MLRFWAEGRVEGGLKLSVAAAIDEQLHVCLRVFEQLFIVPEAFTVGQIQRDRTHREGDRLLQASSRSRRRAMTQTSSNVS